MFLYTPSINDVMKRGALFLLLLLVCATGVLAVNESVGTFKKSPGQNWTVDGHRLLVVRSERMLEDRFYLSFDGVANELFMSKCTRFDNYNVCFKNSSLGPKFDPEIKATPYIYEMVIVAEVAKLVFTSTPGKTTILAGETVQILTKVENTGSNAAYDMRFQIDVKGAGVVRAGSQCANNATTLWWEGDLQFDSEHICFFDVRATNVTTISITPKVNFSDGRIAKVVSGGSVSIAVKGVTMRILLDNQSIGLGDWRKARLVLNNTHTDSVRVSGTIDTDGLPLRGEGSFDVTVDDKEGTVLPFEIQLTGKGNRTIRASATMRSGQVSGPLEAKTTLLVPAPELKVRTFGTLGLDVPGDARLIIEVQNDEDFPFHAVQAMLSAPRLSLPAAPAPITVQPGRNEQLYVATFNVPFTNDKEVIAINVTGRTPEGDEVTVLTNATVIVGTPPKTPGAPAAQQKPKPGQQPPAAKGEAVVTPEQIESRNRTTLFLGVAIAVIIVGCIAWLIAQVRHPPQEPATGFERFSGRNQY